MKVLILSANTLLAAPSGPAYVAGAVRQAGHEVRIFDCLVANDPLAELSSTIDEFQPDVVGVSIRFVFDDEIDANSPLGTRHTDLRPHVKEIIEIVRQTTDAKIVLGGPGFNYYARDWLEYLGQDYGIRGEGEEAFPLFLKILGDGEDITRVPGCVFYKEGRFGAEPPIPVRDLDHQALPAYDLLNWKEYADKNITPAVLTKRGCAFPCTYCPYSKLEGKSYRLKSPERVIEEARFISQSTKSTRVMFCENNFNAPRSHGQSICQALIKEDTGLQWGTGDLRPVGVTADFCRLMRDSGCYYVNLSVESASPLMLKSMRRGYTVEQVRNSVESLSRSSLRFSASLMFGCPGESPQTIAETLSVMDDYEIPLGTWVTIGVYLWTEYQDLVIETLKSGYMESKADLFRGAIYLSPELPKAYLRELPDLLNSRPNYSVQFNKPDAAWMP